MIYDPELRTLAELPEAQARRHGARIALVCDDASLSYAELARQTSALAGALRGRGIEPGSRVAVLSKESIASVTLLLALARCGAVLVPVNWRLSPAEVAFIARHSQCRALFVSREHLSSTQAVERDCAVSQIEDLPWDAAADTAAPLPSVDPHDVAAHVYTSGTTGLPKAVELPHDSFFAIAREFWQRGEFWLDWADHEVGLCILPSFHVGGLWWLMRVLASGGTAVLLPQFVGWRAIEAIERHRVTMTAVVPAMLHVMLSEPDADPKRFTSLRVIGYGGAPMPPPLLARAMAVFGCDFHQVYGLSETGNMAVSLSAEDHRVPRLRSAVGRPLPGVSVKIVDETGKELAPFEVGEICIKSPARMRGYWQNPEATRSVLQDGWLRTGDAGHLDDAGYLYVSDRIKDMICSAGEKVWPAEVEAVLAEHPQVREIAVIGVPHPEWGETVKAVVVPLAPGMLALGELRGFARGRLAEFKLPSSLELVEALPRTPAGKVQKRLLRESYAVHS